MTRRITELRWLGQTNNREPVSLSFSVKGRHLCRPFVFGATGLLEHYGGEGEFYCKRRGCEKVCRRGRG